MNNGIYEKVLNKVDLNKIDDSLLNHTRKIDDSELAKVLSIAYEDVIRDKLSKANKDEIDNLINELNKTLNIEDFQYDESYRELLTLHSNKEDFDKLNMHRPKTSIATSTLFTGIMGPSLISELKREIRTADEICFLVSFIKNSGLRLIYDDLIEFTKTKKLRVITTSYMGASDFKAILDIAKLPNTEVKISYDVDRTRLHAKAYYFKRVTGFSTAYIGSSNISNPALSEGLEWNLKVSEYTSKDVINSFIKNFESYWNDDEFVIFNPNDEKKRKELKKSLDSKKNYDNNYIFFDLKPYSHQKEILENLELERSEYNSYRNLVVAATGERVIIVTGCINVFKSRVSGTLAKYNSCIA